MRKVILTSCLLSILVLSVGCLKGTVTKHETSSENGLETPNIDNANDYKITDNVYIYDKDKKNSYQVKYVQITGMKDKSLEKEINRTLKHSVTECLNENSDWMEEIKYTVTFSNKNYLSLYYEKEWSASASRGYSTTRFGVTVDINNGKRLFLNDFIHDSSILRKILVDYDYNNEHCPPIDAEQADEIIQEISISEMDCFLETSHESERTPSKDFFHHKASFYLKDNQIIIMRNKIDNIGDLADIYIYSKHDLLHG